MKTRVLVVWLVPPTILVSAIGCRNTARGFGRDVEKAGEKIQEKVD